MKALELRNKSETELINMLLDFKKQMFNIRFQVSLGDTSNFSKIKFLRKDVARVKTILTELELKK